jgi:hypothetical protein
MPASLTPSIRADIAAALPPGAAGADPTDDDLVRALVITLATTRALVTDLARGAARPATPATAPDPDPVLRALGGEQVKDAPEWAKRAIDEAAALHKRASADAAGLAEARKSLADLRRELTSADTAGSERFHNAVARAIAAAASEGRVPDDLPPTLRPLVQPVVDLRAQLDVAERKAGLVVDLPTKGNRAGKGPATSTDWAEKRASYEAELKELRRELKGVQRAKDLLQGEAAHRAEQVERANKEIAESRAALPLAAEALDLPKSAKPETVIARMAERLKALAPPPAPKPPRARAAAPTPIPAPLPPPEPPSVREVSWRELQPGDLALDRAAYRALRDQGADLDPYDPRRRVLVLRSGDRVTHLRTDGLHEEGVVPADAPAFRPGRQLRDARSLRALVIAEDVQAEPHSVRDAFRAFLDACTAARCLPALLDEQPGPEAEGEGMLPTTATTAATIKGTGGGGGGL